MQFAQDVVGQMAARLGFTVDVNRHFVVFPTDFFDKGPQVQHGGIKIGSGCEFLVINGQHKGACAGLLLCELRQVSVAGCAQHLEAFALDCTGNGTDAQAGRVV